MYELAAQRHAEQETSFGILVKDTLIYEILSIQVGREEGEVGEGAYVASCYRIWDKLCLV